MSITDRNVDRALLVLRFAVAFTFFAHGSVKLFAMGHDNVTSFFGSVGIPLPGLAAWGVALLEFGGGLALMAGMFTRVLAALFVVNMLAAIGFVVHSNGFVGGYELEFLLAAGSLSLALAGGGAYALDARRAAPAANATE